MTPLEEAGSDDLVARVEEIVKKLRKELELYERILESLSECQGGRKRAPVTAGVEEVNVKGRSIATIIWKNSEVIATLSKPVEPGVLKLDVLRRKLGILLSGSFTLEGKKEDGRHVTKIKVGGLKTPASMELATRALKKHLEDIFGAG